MNDILLERIEDLKSNVDSLIAKIEQVNEAESRLLSFKLTAGRLGDDVRDLRQDTERRLRALERGSWIMAITLFVFFFGLGIAAAYLFLGTG